MSADNIGKSKLRDFAMRIARLEDEKTALVEDIRTVKAEASGEGYNVKALAAAIKKHRMTPEQLSQIELFEEETHLYFEAINGADE
jgi:uncharacterized protein (UPF0335 family)